jgi:hypothetical protein
MNDVEQLRERLGERFPCAALTMDPAETASGSWWLDVEMQGHLVVVEWRPGEGFGISTPAADDYGVGPDEIYPDGDAVFKRLKRLLLTATAGSRRDTEAQR